MTPLEPALIALVWAYALAWMLLLDQIKIWAYAALDRRREALADPGYFDSFS
jgi:DNA-binding helix-hairpin-helix protein with protein kinase domain